MNKCILCNSSLELILDLGEQSLANALLESDDSISEKFFLRLSRCESCGHIQLIDKINPSKLFSKYLWVTGTSKAAKKFSFKLKQKILDDDTHSKRILEIASNDGTFLQPFKEAGHYVLGVDPAENIAEIAQQKNIPTICSFFNCKFAKDHLNTTGKKYDVILARNVIAHTPDPIDFLKGVYELLSEDGYAYIEFHDAFHILIGNQYDSIYHEHYSYFFLQTFLFAAKQNYLKVVDIIESPISGGALIAKLSINLNHPVSENVNNKIRKDNQIQIMTRDAWLNFAQYSLEHSRSLYKIVDSFSKEGKIYGYGSSARSNTMIAFSGINNKQIECIIDNSPLKQNKYTPGTKIEITSLEKLPKKNFILLLLAWNFAEEIIDDLRKKGFANIKVIQPLPNLPKYYDL